MAINYERIGFNIKQCRKNAGLTQRVLAEKVGCTPEHFSHIEKGSRKVQLEMLVAICKHLNVSIDRGVYDLSWLDQLCSEMVQVCGAQHLTAFLAIVLDSFITLKVD